MNCTKVYFSLLLRYTTLYFTILYCTILYNTFWNYTIPYLLQSYRAHIYYFETDIKTGIIPDINKLLLIEMNCASESKQSEGPTLTGLQEAAAEEDPVPSKHSVTFTVTLKPNKR